MAAPDIQPAAPRLDAGSYVDWAAILAGALLATAISFVLFAFGAAIGLSAVSPEGGVPSSRWLSVAAGLWFIWVVISSTGAGAYLAGRLRRRVGDATPDESEARDGAHGLLVWAAATLIGAAVATSGISTVVRGASSVAGSVAQTAASATGGAAGSVAGIIGGDVDYYAGLIQRGNGNVPGNPEVRREIGAILSRSLQQGEVSDADRSYMTDLVAQATGSTPEAVRAQVDDALAQLATARQAAVDAAEAARVAGVITAFLVAATLLVAAAAAYFAAAAGGDHRDRNIAFRTLFR